MNNYINYKVSKNKSYDVFGSQYHANKFTLAGYLRQLRTFYVV